MVSKARDCLSLWLRFDVSRWITQRSFHLLGRSLEIATFNFPHGLAAGSNIPLTRFPGQLVDLLGKLFGGDLIFIPECVAFFSSEDLCQSMAESDG